MSATRHRRHQQVSVHSIVWARAVTIVILSCLALLMILAPGV
jgi:hypothetical protein